MYMTYDRFEELYNQYMEKLNNNANVIKAYIDGKKLDDGSKVFAPFCNKDDKFIPIKDYMVDLYSPCEHNLDLETTHIKIHKHFISIDDIFTGETMYISISPRDINKTYTILNNVFNNTLLDIKTIKYNDGIQTDYVQNCNFYTSKIYKTLNIPKYSKEASCSVPNEISAGILVPLMQLNNAISKYVKNSVISNAKIRQKEQDFHNCHYRGIHTPPQKP